MANSIRAMLDSLRNQEPESIETGDGVFEPRRSGCSALRRGLEKGEFMKRRKRWLAFPIGFVIPVFSVFGLPVLMPIHNFEPIVYAQTTQTSTPVFDQAAEIAKLREAIKGKETEPAEKVFKNIQTLKGFPARNVIAIMEMGFSRSLGVNCTHCHTPGKWEAEDKTQKQIAREMWAMVGTINTQLLTNIKNLKSEKPIVNCTTCHRGELKPALNLPVAAAKPGS